MHPGDFCLFIELLCFEEIVCAVAWPDINLLVHSSTLLFPISVDHLKQALKMSLKTHCSCHLFNL